MGDGFHRVVIDVDADDFHAAGRQGHRRREADVPQADYGHPARENVSHSALLSWAPAAAYGRVGRNRSCSVIATNAVLVVT